jgi:hypothetical protein
VIGLGRALSLNLLKAASRRLVASSSLLNRVDAAPSAAEMFD